jgi:hypothetical protein
MGRRTDDEALTPLAKIGVDPDSLLGASRHDWNDEGVVLLPEALTPFEGRMQAYEAVWMAEHGYGWPPKNADGWMGADGGWPDPCPYMRHPEIIEMCAPLAEPLANLLGGEAGLHLNLTGWVSTERDWHQDSYLNPTGVGDRYAAIWLALEDIHPDSGPFQYVPGSHKWPQITQEKIFELLDGYRERDWPKVSEDVLTPIFEQAIQYSEQEVVTYLPQRGDVLVWHGRLLHRGSKPNVPGMRRKAFIAHFSRVDARPDMPTPRLHDSGMFYFPIGAA